MTYYFETLISAIQNLSTQILLRICKNAQKCYSNWILRWFSIMWKQRKNSFCKACTPILIHTKRCLFLKWGPFQLITSSYFIISIKLQHIWRMCNSVQLAKNDTTFVFFSQGNKHSFRVNCHWMLNMQFYKHELRHFFWFGIFSISNYAGI